MSTTIRFERRELLLAIDHVDADRGGRPVLRDVCAQIHNVVRADRPAQGQVVAVLGPSGAGKTTLMRLIAGLDAPARGAITIGATQQPAAPGRVGVVQQRSPLFEHRTVRANLELAARRRDPRTAAAAATEALARFGLAARADAWPGELSGGERQRVAIAQQLLVGHTFVVLDEPFAGLDPHNRARACALVAEVAAAHDHATLIVVTHDLREAATIADTLWLLGRDPTDGASRLVATYDLAERGLAWQPDVARTPAFAALVRELEDRFAAL